MIRRDNKLRVLPTLSAKSMPATVVAFPTQSEWVRHMSALQVLALARPKAAKAVLHLTDTLAKQVTRSKTG